MKIRSVIDLKKGLVVLGKGGNRTAYQPVKSILANSVNPVELAIAFRDRLGLNRLYLADLDSIGGGIPNVDLYQQLADMGIDLWIDAGVKMSDDANPISKIGTVVAGLETLVGPDELEKLQRKLCNKLVFSLDHRQGIPLGWGRSTFDVACQAVTLGIRNILLLDLARVGSGEGTGTEDLCRLLLREIPDLHLSVGGGVCSVEEINRLRDIGVEEVLIASALHNGSITREDL
ncbi:MAG: HisA/HisF-related TIM barrel protein, partial [Gemmataceae bacterium]